MRRVDGESPVSVDLLCERRSKGEFASSPLSPFSMLSCVKRHGLTFTGALPAVQIEDGLSRDQKSKGARLKERKSSCTHTHAHARANTHTHTHRHRGGYFFQSDIFGVFRDTPSLTSPLVLVK